MRWRPDNWEYQDVLLIDIDIHPNKTWDVAHSYGWSNGYEAGADAMLGGVIDLVEEMGYKRVADDLRIYCGLIEEEDND